VPFRFRKTVKVPGLPIRLNLNGKSASVTLGGKHTPHVTYSTTGRRTESVDLPGPFSWRKTSRRRR